MLNIEAKLKKEKELETEEKRKRDALLAEIKKQDRDNQIKWDFNQKVYHIMRDNDNQVLRNTADELETQKGKLLQYRYSEGDPGALEEEGNKYRLSKTDQFDMTDRMSGEQNRMVYDQVRPSYFGDKKEKPHFDSPLKRIKNAAGHDITMTKSSDKSQTFNKSNLKIYNSLGTTNNGSPGVIQGDKWEGSLRKVPGANKITRKIDLEESKSITEGDKVSKISFILIGSTKNKVC